MAVEALSKDDFYSYRTRPRYFEVETYPRCILIGESSHSIRFADLPQEEAHTFRRLILQSDRIGVEGTQQDHSLIKRGSAGTLEEIASRWANREKKPVHFLENGPEKLGHILTRYGMSNATAATIRLLDIFIGLGLSDIPNGKEFTTMIRKVNSFRSTSNTSVDVEEAESNLKGLFKWIDQRSLISPFRSRRARARTFCSHLNIYLGRMRDTELIGPNIQKILTQYPDDTLAVVVGYGHLRLLRGFIVGEEILPLPSWQNFPDLLNPGDRKFMRELLEVGNLE